LKVSVGGKVFINDYLCCDKPFHLSLQALATCTVGQGFKAVKLEVVHVDPIEFQHSVDLKLSDSQGDSPGDQSFVHIDYGRFGAVEKAIRNFLTMKTGRPVLFNSDGSVTDPLESAGRILEDIVNLNTGHRCPQVHSAYGSVF